MSVLIVLISLSLLAALGFLGAFIWAVKSGQFDDFETPSMRMLMENKKSSIKNNQK